MKNLINGNSEIMYIKNVDFVHVPQFDELKPLNVLKKMNLQENNKTLYKKILNYCPEIKYRGYPKDREFFFNILNTIEPKIVDKMVISAFKHRQ